jgi:acetylornithine deacetylase/succinyl-diaminopimelate desuccinylase-like protein
MNHAIAPVLAHLNENRLLELQLRYAETPAPTFDESRRAGVVAQIWRDAGLDPHIDGAGNVLALRPGQQDEPVLVISAHLDTVFPIEQDVRVRRPGDWCDYCETPGVVPEGEYHGPGVSDCAAGLASVTGVIEALQARSAFTPSSILFAAVVGEEGIGDLKGTRHLFASEWGPRIGAFITVDIGVRGALIHTGVASYRYRFTFRGPGGHAWDNFGRYNPLHAAGLAVGKIALYKAPTEPRTSYNVGVISGGRSINAIPESASFELDLRCVEPEGLETAAAHVLELVRAAHEEYASTVDGESSYTAEILGHRPGGATPWDDPLVVAAREAIESEGLIVRTGPASTDANIPIGLGIPAVAFPWGGSERNLHSVRETFRPKDRIKDVRALARLAMTYRVPQLTR